MRSIILFVLLPLLVLNGCFVTGDGIRNMTGNWSIILDTPSLSTAGINGTEPGSYQIQDQNSRIFTGTISSPPNQNETGLIGCIGPDNRSFVMMTGDHSLIIGSFIGSEEGIATVISSGYQNITVQKLERNPVLPRISYNISEITGWWPAITTESEGWTRGYENRTWDGSGIAIMNQSGREFSAMISYLNPDSSNSVFSMNGVLAGDGLTIIGVTNRSLSIGRLMEDKTGIIHELKSGDDNNQTVTTLRLSKNGHYSGPNRLIPDLTGDWEFFENKTITLINSSEYRIQPVVLRIKIHTGSLFSGEMVHRDEGINNTQILGTISDDGRSILMRGEDDTLTIGYLEKPDILQAILIRPDAPSLTWFQGDKL